MELSEGGCSPNLVRNCRWTIVTDRHSWNVSTQNAFSLPFAAINNCRPFRQSDPKYAHCVSTVALSASLTLSTHTV
jgi:hypothetical protein